MKNILLVAILFLSAGCKNTTSPFPIVPDRIVIDPAKVGKIKSVLILGNSIVRHPPAPQIGWNYDWGMAASSQDSDFVHILIRDIKARDSSVKVKFATIVDFEKDYRHFDITKLDSLRSPDMLIMKIAENVTYPDTSYFIKCYDSLINYIDPGKKAVKIIADGFFIKEVINPMINEYAKKNNYTFISLTHLSQDKANTAIGQYQNKDINLHPGNTGMQAIASKFWAAIGPYFKQ